MNVDLLLRVREHIRTHPHELKMSYMISCRSPRTFWEKVLGIFYCKPLYSYCIGGFALLLDGGPPDLRFYKFYMVSNVLKPWNDAIFYVAQWPWSIQRAYLEGQSLNNPLLMAKAAVDAIDYYIQEYESRDKEMVRCT